MDSQTTPGQTRKFRVKRGGRWSVIRIPASAPPPWVRPPPSPPVVPPSPVSEPKDDAVLITAVRHSGRLMRVKTSGRRKGLRLVVSQVPPAGTSPSPKIKGSSPPIETIGIPVPESSKPNLTVESPHTNLKASGKRKLQIPFPESDGSTKKRVPVQESPSQPHTQSTSSEDDSQSPTFGYDLSAAFSPRLFTMENKQNWDTMSKRTLLGERQLNLASFTGTGILEILEDTDWLLTVLSPAPFVSSIVYEFYANLCSETVISSSSKYFKVYVRGKIFEFSPRIINQYFACYVHPLREDELEIEIDLDLVASELTGSTTTWPKKCKLFATRLTTKYSILLKIALFNWIPKLHSTTVSPYIASFLYRLGKGVHINLGNLIFGKVVSEINSKVSKRILGYPSLIYHILMTQLDTKEDGESLTPLGKPFSLSDKLVHGHHVVDIEGDRAYDSASAQSAPPSAARQSTPESSNDVHAALTAVTAEVSDIKTMLASLTQTVNELKDAYFDA